MNTGKQFEILVQHLFRELVSQQLVENIDVKQNVIMQGRLVRHQIDVYWEFQIGGIKYRTVVQAKDWNRPIPQGELLKFKSVLDDLPGQPRGIFVTSGRYQEGAREYADQNGILLYELKSQSAPLGPECKSLVFNLNSYVPIAKALRFTYDQEWITQEKRRLGIPDGDKFSANIRTDGTGQVMLFNESDVYVGSIKDVATRYFVRDFREKAPFEVEHVFDAPTFVQADLVGFRRAKVRTLHMLLEVRKQHEMFVFDADDFIAFTLVNLSEQTRHVFNERRKLLN